MTQTKSSNTRILVECAMLVAVASVLCIFPKFSFLPYGGSITVCSMLPIILISYRRGLKWGLLSGVVFSLVQMLTGLKTAGFSLFAIVMVVLFDYILAFTLLGLGGMFRGKFNSVAKELALGSFVVLMIRFACHVISGYFVWGEYAEWFFSQAGDWGANVLARVSGNALALLYSVVYNATYMVPEIIITVIVAVLISKFALFGIEPKEKNTQPAAE